MSEAMLIMHMPVMCGTCLCFGENEETYKHYCRVPLSIDDDTVSFYEKPDWCPLIPEPERMATDDTGILSAFVAGWNACLDALEGKENE